MRSNEPLVLKFIDIFVKPFLNRDLNYAHIREILKLKLIIESRNVSISAKMNPKREKKQSKKSLLIMCLIYIGVGILIGLMQMMKNLFGANLFAYSMLMFMLFSVYISEFSSVLLDTTEKTFYGVLPIGRNEISVAKNIHIAYYVGIISGSMMLPSVVMGIIFHGVLYALFFLLAGVIVTIFCLRLAGAIYYALLKMFSGERLKDILSGFQVFVTITLVLSYQIIPRVIDFAELSRRGLSFSPIMFIVPSAWFSAIFGIVFDAKFDTRYFLLIAAGTAFLILLEILYRKKIVPEFEGELDKLTETSKENKSLSVFSRLMCKVFSKDKQELAFMELVLIQVSRNRNIKLKLYPQLANALLLPVIILLSQLSRNNDIGEMINNVRMNTYFVALLYSVGLSSSAIYTLIGRAENKESKMFYQVLPIENLSKCIRAGVKVVLFRYLTPMFILLSIMFFAIYGGRIWIDVLISYTAFLFITSLMIRLNAWVLPFSTETVTNNSGFAIMLFFINMTVSGGFAAAHMLLLKTLTLKLVGFAVMAVLNLILWKLFMNKKYVIERY